MISSKDSFKSKDGKEIHFYQWSPDLTGSIVGAVQIAHGMSEHAGRYAHFADELTKQGWIVYANDHRGHGLTAEGKENLGFFAYQGGWDLAVGDMAQLNELIRGQHSLLPVYLFGHSMGSFLTRDFIAHYGQHVNGAVICATGGGSSTFIETTAGCLIARFISLLFGKKSPSRLVNALVFGPYNRKIKPKRTDFDWLSRDKGEVDKYMQDPFCGFICSAGFYHDLFKGVRKVSSKKHIQSTPSNLPILFVAGDADPVGKYGKGVQWVVERYTKLKLNKVNAKYYKQARHELLNETNRKEVYSDIIQWLNEQKGA